MFGLEFRVVVREECIGGFCRGCRMKLVLEVWLFSVWGDVVGLGGFFGGVYWSRCV